MMIHTSIKTSLLLGGAVIGIRAQSGTTGGNSVGAGAFMDLQNVQLLKGPQGTLFGRNTTGGAILLVPKKPTDKLEGYVEGTLGNYNAKRVQAAINIPLGQRRFRRPLLWPAAHVGRAAALQLRPVTRPTRAAFRGGGGLSGED